MFSVKYHNANVIIDKYVFDSNFFRDNIFFIDCDGDEN